MSVEVVSVVQPHAGFEGTWWMEQMETADNDQLY